MSADVSRGQKRASSVFFVFVEVAAGVAFLIAENSECSPVKAQFQTKKRENILEMTVNDTTTDTKADGDVEQGGLRHQPPVQETASFEDSVKSASSVKQEHVETRNGSNQIIVQHHHAGLRPATKPPKETLQAVYTVGKYKANLTLTVLTVQSFMAGMYIAMAGHMFLAVGGGILGAALFPAGLIAVLLTSGELFTGDALIFVASVLGKQVTFGRLVRNWTVSWFGNFAGCLTWALLLAFLSDALEDSGQAELAVAVALKKAHQPWMHILLKGIGANLMVCLGVWQWTCVEEAAGKILALWFPITGFVAAGLDHCIANQFLIPVGMMLMAKNESYVGDGKSITVAHLLFRALLPATIGNLIGGGIFIGAVYWFVFDSLHRGTSFRNRIFRDIMATNPVSGTVAAQTNATSRTRNGRLFRRTTAELPKAST